MALFWKRTKKQEEPTPIVEQPIESSEVELASTPEQKASFFIAMLKSFYHYQKDTSYASLRHLQSQVSVLKQLSSLF